MVGLPFRTINNKCMNDEVSSFVWFNYNTEIGHSAVYQHADF